MASHKGLRGFNLDVPRKRERDFMALKQLKGEAQIGQRMTAKIHKAPRNPREWEDEDWGEDSES